VLPPGGEGEIKVTLRPKGNHTRISKRIVVHTNDPEQPEFALTMQGTLLIDMVAEPGSLSIPDLKVGKPGRGTFSLQRTEGSKAEIRSVAVEDQQQFSVKQIEAQAGAAATYEVRFRGRDSVGTSTTRVVVKTSGENTPELFVPVQASAALNLRYIDNVRFARKNGAILPRVVRISARHGDAPRIDKVEDADGLLEVEVLEAQGPMASIRLKVLADRVPVDDNARAHPLIVHTSDRDEPRLQLEYRILSESQSPRPAKVTRAAGAAGG